MGRPVSLFWIGTGPIFRPLFDRLGSDYPFIPVTLSKENLALIAPPFRMEAIAACIARQIRDYEPQGPYHIGGWSLDGLLAYETAQQLTKWGCQVALTVLVDPANPSFRRSSPIHKVIQRIRRELFHLSRLRQMAFSESLAYLGGRLNWLSVRLRRRRWEAAYKKNPAAEGSSKGWEEILWLCATTYIASPYAGRVLLVEAQHRSVDPSGDIAAAWSKLVRNLETCRVPGDHASMFEEPNAALLADSIRTAIRRFEYGLQ